MARESQATDALLTRDQVQAVINHKLENTILWLNKAYDARPSDPVTEKTLLELMAALGRLRLDANESMGRKLRVGGAVRSAPASNDLENLAPLGGMRSEVRSPRFIR